MSQEKLQKKKILFLTLGTGKKDEKNPNAPSYRPTQYVIEGKLYQKNGVATETNFVAEPIINSFVPNEIFILGTAKSCWYEFYASTITTSNDDKSYLDDLNYQRLFKIEKENGINTNSEELKKLEDEITEILTRTFIDKWKKYSDKYDETNHPRIHILLTKYGINEAELKENYGILKRIESYLDEQCEYEVAFDITHSFRSLPIYNLIIFNYIKNITKNKLSITHIYYGNLDASHELGKKTPIVDLVDLVNVLDLTSSVTEFKDTGNAVSLLQMLDDTDELKSTLEKFDLATQLNAFDKVKEELQEICKLIAIKTSGDRYTGVREMIETVLEAKFFDKENIGIDKLNEISDVDLKFLLTRWFFNQNRMGLGLATGLEALRDICTPAFMKAYNHQGKNERTFRETAEHIFIELAKKMQSNENKTNLEETVCVLGVNLKHYKDIRNSFAHSLNNSATTDLIEIRRDVNEFKDRLFTLKDLYDKNPEDFEKIFIPKKAQATTSNTNDNCRIIIGPLQNCKLDNYKKSNKGIKYDVFYLDSKVENKIFGGIDKSKYDATEKAYFMLKYLEERISLRYDEVQIIFVNLLDGEKKMIFEIFMESLVNNDKRIKLFDNNKPCRKNKICIALEEQKKQLSEKEIGYVSIMNIPLKQA